MTAAMYGDEETVNQLIDLGWWVDKPSSTGLTPLMAAVINRDPRMVHVLLTRGANPNVEADEGRTPADIAYLAENDDLARSLREREG